MAEKKWYPSLGQEVIEEVLDIGLQIVILPKSGFQTRFASFASKYGGMDNAFYPPGKQDLTKVPAGIAHFLEHKMFEQPDQTNILDVYSRMGVDANAATSKNWTCYYFSVTDEKTFKPAFDILLNYVQTPYFTDENVKKEQGIIQQEIASGLDRPGTVAYTEFEAALYHNHPAGVNVIGTVESVAAITKEYLYECHKTFYHPSNMMVIVCGDLDPDEIIRTVKNDIESRGYPNKQEIKRPIYDEPASVKSHEVVKSMKVSRPIIIIGFKGPVVSKSGNPPSPDELQRRRLVGSITLESIFGKTSELYWDLYSKGILTRDFSYGFVDYGTACHVMVYGETDIKTEFIDAVGSTLAAARDNGISADSFELARRTYIGRLLSSLDSPDDLALRYMGELVNGINMMNTKEVLDSLSIEECNSFLRELIRDNNMVVSSVVPLDGEEEGK